MLWHPKTLQILLCTMFFFIFGRFSIAGKLPKWPKIPFQYPLALRHPKILEKCRKHHRILVSVRNRFWAPPAKADIATAILTNVIEHLVLLFCPPISTPSPPKRCGRIYETGVELPKEGGVALWRFGRVVWVNLHGITQPSITIRVNSTLGYIN